MEDAANALMDLFPCLPGKAFSMTRYKVTRPEFVCRPKSSRAMHITCYKPKTESQAEFLFSDLKYKSELSFEEWFEIVKKFHQMCAQVHCPPASSEVKSQTLPKNTSKLIKP